MTQFWDIVFLIYKLNIDVNCAYILLISCCREANRRVHSKADSVPFVAERTKHVVGEVE